MLQCYYCVCCDHQALMPCLVKLIMNILHFTVGYICVLAIFQLHCPDGGVVQYNDDGTVSCDGLENDLNSKFLSQILN